MPKLKLPSYPTRIDDSDVTDYERAAILFHQFGKDFQMIILAALINNHKEEFIRSVFYLGNGIRHNSELSK